MRFTYDATTSRLEYAATMPAAVSGAALHRRDGKENNGPAIAVIVPSTAGTTTIRLSAADRDALEHGRLYLEVVTKNATESARTPLRLH